MRIRIVQICDIHAKSDMPKRILDAERVIRALSPLEKADKYIIAMSGDISFSGKKEEFDLVYDFLHRIFTSPNLPRNNEYIQIVCVPGNHDVDFFGANLANNSDDFKVKYEKSIRSPELDKLSIQSDYFGAMKMFFRFSKGVQCDWGTKADVNKQVIDCNGYKIGFVLVNSAVMSLLGGDGIDKGCHFLTDNQIEEIEKATDAKINCLIMHHGIEWFNDATKKKLRNILAEKYAIVLSGHEHDEIAETKVINDSEPCFYMQANAFNDAKAAQNGFSVLDIDTCEAKLIAQSFCLNNDIYSPSEVGSVSIQRYSVGGIRNNEDYLHYLKSDHNGDEYKNYFCFPSIEYTSYDEKNTKIRHEFKSESNLVDFIVGKDRISISGNKKSGRTTLCKMVYLQLIDRGIVPIIFDSSIHQMRENRIIEYSFSNQYRTDNNSYERFKQLPRDKKIAIIDDADLIKPKSLNALIESLDKTFATIILVHKTEVPTDIHKQILEAIDDNYKLQINSYWYKARKELISKVLVSKNVTGDKLDSEVNQINDFISNQIKYFNLTPEFIIDFTNLFIRNNEFQYSSGKNAFSMVYENSIKNRIISNSESISPEVVVSIVQEIAYYMHFTKKPIISTNELIQCLQKYDEDYRQKTNYNNFISIIESSDILIENGNDYHFKDKTLLAYFVARAINQKASDQSDQEYLEAEKNFLNLLDNLCFGINSDIVLFLSVITNSTRFINLIIDKAESYFEEVEELLFEKNNVSFITNTSIQIKNKLPGNEEKKKRYEQISESERQARTSDVIEAVNEYDYSDEDLDLYINKIQKAYKFLEIISKTLPAFCMNMKRNQQDRLVNLVYRAPNKFLYMVLKDIINDYDGFVDNLYNDISSSNGNGEKVSREIVERFAKQISAVLIIEVYRLVAATAASNESKYALNAFPNIQESTNYELLNLMFKARTCDVNTLAQIAIPMDNKADLPIAKTMIKFTVNDYFLRNDFALHGEGDSLADHFFGKQNKKQIQIDMAKKKFSSK